MGWPLPHDDEITESAEDAVAERMIGTTTNATAYENRILASQGIERCPNCDCWATMSRITVFGFCTRCENARLGV